jgi:hypothetical protein
MSIPLDRLYNFLSDAVNSNILIYRWFPHGSKNISDLLPLKDYPTEHTMSFPSIVCHDQEPLNFDLYNNDQTAKAILSKKQVNYDQTADYSNSPSLARHFYEATTPLSYYDKQILLHSEKNSKEIDRYLSHSIPVFVWSHALIATDWYRYAQHDHILKSKSVKKDFLIYSRAWTGSREYRLKFLELIIQNNLYPCSTVKFSPVDSNLHYSEYQFKNKNFTITNKNIDQFFLDNSQIGPNASADYDTTEYMNSAIEVVLETLFDDPRIFLTEKILRPIACNTPFILCSGPYSLMFLKSYGIRTFGDIIDESYDLIENSTDRLNSVINTMKYISGLPSNKKQKLFRDMQKISTQNQKMFFSKKFFNCVVNEFKSNLKPALKEIENYKNSEILNYKRKKYKLDI